MWIHADPDPQQGCRVPYLLGAEGVDDAGLARVGIADEADGDLLGLLVELAQLPEQVDEGALAKGMVQRGMEGDRRIFLTKKVSWYSHSLHIAK